MKTIWNFVTTLALVVMLCLVAIMYIPGFFGIKPMIVLSGSMEPKYPVGSLLYIDKKGLDHVKVGDVITFYLDQNTLVTHRVVAVDEQNKTYQTKGDANNVPDGEPVAFDKVLGKPVISVPKLGFIADKLSQKTGKIIYIAAILAVVILMWIGNIIWPEKKRKVRE